MVGGEGTPLVAINIFSSSSLTWEITTTIVIIIIITNLWRNTLFKRFLFRHKNYAKLSLSNASTFLFVPFLSSNTFISMNHISFFFFNGFRFIFDWVYKTFEGYPKAVLFKTQLETNKTDKTSKIQMLDTYTKPNTGNRYWKTLTAKFAV